MSDNVIPFVTTEHVDYFYCECGSHEFSLYQDDHGVVTAECAWCEEDTEIEMCLLEELEDDGDSV